MNDRREHTQQIMDQKKDKSREQAVGSVSEEAVREKIARIRNEYGEKIEELNVEIFE